MVGWSGYTHSISGFTGPLMSVTEYERKTVLHVNMIDDKPYDVSVMIKTPTNIALTPGDTKGMEVYGCRCRTGFCGYGSAGYNW